MKSNDVLSVRIHSGQGISVFIGAIASIIIIAKGIQYYRYA